MLERKRGSVLEIEIDRESVCVKESCSGECVRERKREREEVC